jgi:hypothetical protein
VRRRTRKYTATACAREHRVGVEGQSIDGEVGQAGIEVSPRHGSIGTSEDPLVAGPAGAEGLNPTSKVAQCRSIGIEARRNQNTFVDIWNRA